MTFRKIHKAGAILLTLCLAFLSGCSPSTFTSVIYVTPVPSPILEVSPTPTQEPSPSQEPTTSISSEPLVEPYDYSHPAPESEKVDDNWFADAAFVGDSRTDGLRIYGGIKQGDFLAYKGLMCRDLTQKACITSGDEKITVEQALKKKEYGKIFIMLGLNELGFKVEDFAQDYAALIDQMREIQPNAVLYFQSLVPINDQKAREKDQPYYVTNEQIALFNAEVTRLAQEKQVILLDMATALSGEDGQLPYDATNDGVHFNRSWYEKWFAYLKTHTVDPKRLEAAQ